MSMRMSWDVYWSSKLEGFGERATCDRGKSGAILVDADQQIIATGYVGAPRGLDHCDEVGHLIREVKYEDGSVHQHCMRTAHAERNAIVQAARRGVAVNGATLYCTMEPCLNCAVDVINVGVVRVVAKFKYHGAELTRRWFEQAGVKLDVMSDDMPEYSKKAPYESPTCDAVALEDLDRLWKIDCLHQNCRARTGLVNAEYCTLHTMLAKALKNRGASTHEPSEF